MEYNKIIAVTGMPGLYELLSSKTDGAIVRSLDDKTTKFVSSRVHNFSHLESIEIYTVRDNVNLVDILKAMESSGEKLPNDKDGAALKTYFSKVYPDLDFDRVYSSDLKKMVKWYSVLKNNDIEIKLSEPPAEEEPAEEAAEKPAAKKPATATEKAPAAKKPAEDKPKKAEEEEAPAAKKAPAKKKAESEEKKEKPAATKPAAAAAAKEKAPAKKAAEDKPKKAAAKKK